MRGAFRLLIACGLTAVIGVIAASGSGAATTAAAGTAAVPLVKAPSRFAVASAPIVTQFTQGFAGYITGPAATSSTASTTFRVPHPTCTATDTGIVPGAFIENGPTTSETLDLAGVFVGCISGKARIGPTADLGSAAVTIPTTDKVSAGDIVKTTVATNASGTTVTIQNTNTTRAFTFSQHGTDTSPQAELFGVDSALVNNVEVPPPTFAAAKFTASTLNGAALKSAPAINKLVWSVAGGCATVLLPSALDATGEIFTVKAPAINITSISPTHGTGGTLVTITGNGFNSSSAVTFKGGAATAVNRSGAPAQLIATAPATVKTGSITVKNTTAPVGSITSACKFSVP